MKKLLFLFLSIAVLLPSCKDDDDIINDNALQYDGDNQNAPVFEVGVSEAAAYFPASYISNFSGKKIKDIEFYLRDVPASTVLKVLAAGTGNTPGSPIFEVDLSNDVQGNSWNRYVLSETIELASAGIWLSLEVTHNNADERSVGCDAGPADSNGDWIFSDTDNEWKTLRNRTNNTVDINWNIRANLE